MLRLLLDVTPTVPLFLPLLAQTPTSSGPVGDWLLTLACLLGILLVVLQIWERLFPRAHPPLHEKYASKADLAKLKQDLDAELDSLDGKLEDSVERIEHRFEQWLAEMAKHSQEQDKTLREWQQGVERTLGRIEAKVK